MMQIKYQAESAMATLIDNSHKKTLNLQQWASLSSQPVKEQQDLDRHLKIELMPRTNFQISLTTNHLTESQIWLI